MTASNLTTPQVKSPLATSGLELTNVSVRRGGQVLLSDINLRCAAGTVTSVRKSGVLQGGSSFLLCCAGVLAPAQGSVCLGGAELVAMTPTERFSRLQYCYDHRGLLSFFSVFENLMLPVMYHNLCPPHQARERALRFAAELQIEHLFQREPSELSDRQTRLVNFLRALVIDPQVYLLDELQTGLDRGTLNRIIAILEMLKASGRIVLMVSTADARDEFADHCLLLRQQTLEVIDCATQ